MRLNHDCIRSVMLYLEENLEIASLIDTKDINLPNFSQDDIDYSIIKMLEANYLDGKVYNYSYDMRLVEVKSISWEGHQFLDNIRDSKVWSNTKSKLSTFSSVSINIMSQVAASVISQMING